MIKANAASNEQRINEEQTGVLFDSWSEDDIEELQDETPWEKFAWEINNWASLNFSSKGYVEI